MGICKSQISYSYDKHLMYDIFYTKKDRYLQIYIRSKNLNIDIFIYFNYHDYSINESFTYYSPIIFNIGKIEYVNNEKLFLSQSCIAENKLFYNNNLVFIKTLEYIEYYDHQILINNNKFYYIDYDYICSKNILVRFYLLNFYILKIQCKIYGVYYTTIKSIKHFRRNKMFKNTYYLA